MPLSEDVRHELAGVEPLKHCDRLAELSGLFHTAGSLHLLGHGEFSVHLDLAESAVARRAVGLVRSFGVEAEIRTYTRHAFERGTRYQLHLPGEPRALEVLNLAPPDVFNHNLETVPSRYLTVRPGARYFHSLRLLQKVKELDPTIFTKSGIMVGLGEERHEVLQVMDDLRSAEVDFLTIGQYLQPTRKHHAVMRYVTPDEFAGYEKVAYTKGFLMVSASPLTRS